MEKTFVVDWNDYTAVSKLGNMIKSRLGELNPNKISKQQKQGLMFDCCTNIWNTATLPHYQTLELDANPKYYVYCHMNRKWKIWPGHDARLTFAASLGISCSPFYIGKGTGSRSANFNRNGYHKNYEIDLKMKARTLIVSLSAPVLRRLKL